MSEFKSSLQRLYSSVYFSLKSFGGLPLTISKYVFTNYTKEFLYWRFPYLNIIVPSGYRGVEKCNHSVKLLCSKTLYTTNSCLDLVVFNKIVVSFGF